MWNKVDNNCGIGTGGFQPGNKCAKEDGAGSPAKKEEGGGLFGAMIGKLSDKMNDTAKAKADKHRNALNDAPPPPPVKSSPSAKGFQIARKYGLNPAIVNLAEVGHTYIQKHDWKAARQTYLKGIEEVDKESLKERLTRKVKAGLKLIKFQFGRILDWIKDKVNWIRDKVGLGVQNAADNCGTGAGGFKKGNTCAKGSAASFSTVQALGKAITPPGGKPYRISTLAVIPGVTQVGREVHEIPIATFHKYLDDLLERYKGLGFKPFPDSSGWGGDNVTLEHPEGHQIDLIVGRQPRANSVYIATSFVPPEQREGYQVSREAFLHSVPNPNRVPIGIPFGLQELLLRAGSTDAAFLRKLHERFIKYHEAHANQTDHWPDQVIQHHRKAIGLHNIARDYYMDKLGVQNSNCGTGAGGFKRGNTCAGGGKTPSFDTPDELSQRIFSADQWVTVQDLTGIYSKVHTVGSVVPLGKDPVLANRRLGDLFKRAKAAGFKPVDKNSHIDLDQATMSAIGASILLEHPEGHQIDISRDNTTRVPSVDVSITFVKPENRESYQISKDAFLASYFNSKLDKEWTYHRLYIPSQLRMLASTGDATALLKMHNEYRDHHDQILRQAGALSPSLRKGHEEAMGLHGIARDYYMDKLGVQNANCGTGDGGFKKGNTCRWGEHEEVATDRDGLAKAIGMDVKPTDVVSDNSASYHRVFRDGADPEGGWYAMHAATQFERRIEKNLTDLGFKLKKGSASTYEHPQGHMVSITVRMPADNRAELSTYIVFIPKQNREGYMLTIDSLEQSVKAADVYDKHIQAAHSAWLSARQGKLSEAANEHRRAAEAHETAAKGNVSKAVKKGHLDAAAIHRIAYDWYAERAGLQANSWKPIRTGQRGSHVGTGR